MKYFEVDFSITPANRDAVDLLSALAADTGFESFDNSESSDDELKGYVQCELYDEDSLISKIKNFPIKGTHIEFLVRTAEDRDWNESWEEEGFEPVVIDHRCVIHDTRHLPAEQYPIDVIIDAKLAFGTGTHETTRMIASTLLDMHLNGLHVLDCGCGTGILSLIAAKCGANVTGYDIDEWSVNNAMHNAEINNITDYSVFCGDCTLLNKNKDLLRRGPFNVVIANINRNILIHDMPWFTNVLTKGGTLILSGFYESDASMIKQRTSEFGLTLTTCKTDGDWCCCIFQSSLSE